MILLDGKTASKSLLNKLSDTITTIRNTHPKHLPKLVVVLVGDDAASQVYVKKKTETAAKLGLASELKTFPASLPEAALVEEIQQLNEDATVHAILVQLPLPKHIDSDKILQLVSPEKDVDGFHPLNLGKLLIGQPPVALPCTPAGIMTLLAQYEIPIAGQHAVVVGRSNIVGKPVGVLLLQQNATVTFCHSKTQNLGDHTKSADILIVATGVPEMITGDHVSPNTVVVDVGINRVNGKLVGDVQFETVAPKCSHITPVPGGVGPMTIATLMQNTLALYQAKQQA